MLLGAIADDFTGGSDLANTLTKSGMRTRLFVGLPMVADSADCDAGVVALKTRSAPVSDAVAHSLTAARWLLEQGCQQIIFKYCSTFDSTPDGNIGPVAEALLDFLGERIAVVCPAFPATGRRVFMGHLFVGDKLLNECGMQNHPLTPMTDPDLRRWLRQQTKTEVGFVPLTTVTAGASAITAALMAEADMGHRLVVVDAIADSDLVSIGAALAGHRLITGGSGIALGLPANYYSTGSLSAGTTELPAIEGAAVVLCGSCSEVSRSQVAYHLQSYPGLCIDAASLFSGTTTAAQAVEWCIEHRRTLPIVYSSADPGSVAENQRTHGRAEVAGRLEQFFAEVARGLVDRGVSRIVVGGGETSGAVVEALGVDSLSIGSEIDPGVPLLLANRNQPLGLALKSGNFGATDFFGKAIARMAAP
jgi:uncharacterized protein YgbK (DUF1537 family)